MLAVFLLMSSLPTPPSHRLLLHLFYSIQFYSFYLFFFINLHTFSDWQSLAASHSMHSLSICFTVFTELFPAHPSLIKAQNSQLNFTMLRITVLRDVPKQLPLEGMLNNFCQKFYWLWLKKDREAL